MSSNGKINGHKPERLMRSLGAGSESLGVTKLPNYAEASAAAVTSLRSQVPPDAHTAPYLGTEREGHALVIDEDGLVLTIGYLLLECSEIEIMDPDGDWVEAEFVGYDSEIGFGLARATRALDIAPAERGSSHNLAVGTPVIVAGRGGADQSIEAKVVSRRPFDGYWEYHLDEAIFTTPAHPNWGGSALIGPDGRVAAIGSLLVEDAVMDNQPSQGNMFVPIELLDPIYADLIAHGRVRRPSRPWLGMFTAEAQGVLVVTHVTNGGPAAQAGIEPGDVVLRVNEEPVAGLADLYQCVWQLGEAGVGVPLTLVRSGAGVEMVVHSGNRYDFFRTPRV